MYPSKREPDGDQYYYTIGDVECSLMSVHYIVTLDTSVPVATARPADRSVRQQHSLVFCNRQESLVGIDVGSV